MQVTCPYCGAPVPARDVNLERMIAKCERCNGVFGFQAPGAAAPAAAPRRRLVPMPANIKVLVDEASETVPTYRQPGATTRRVVFERRWFRPALLFMALFCVFWDGFLVVWYGAAVGDGNVVALLFPLLHVTAGVFITYTTLSGFVNRTLVSVVDGALTVRHGPLPWPGNRTIPIGELRQLFCEEHVGSKGARSYSLNALLESGGKVRLLSGMPEAEQVLYLEQALEERLGIADVPVAGELV